MRRTTTEPSPPVGCTRRQLCLRVALAMPLTGGAQPPPRTHPAGPGERLPTLAAAVAAAASGDVIELRPGDYRGDVAVVDQARLTIRCRAGRAVLDADGRDAEGCSRSLPVSSSRSQGRAFSAGSESTGSPSCRERGRHLVKLGELATQRHAVQRS